MILNKIFHYSFLYCLHVKSHDVCCFNMIMINVFHTVAPSFNFLEAKIPPIVTFIQPLHAKFNATDKGDPVKILVICFAHKKKQMTGVATA